PHLRLPVSVPSPRRDREDLARPERAHILGDRSRSAQDAPGLHCRLADEKRQVPSHPHGVKARTGGHGALQRFEYLGEGHDTRPLVVAIPKVVAKKVGNLLNYLESVLHRAEVRLDEDAISRAATEGVREAPRHEIAGGLAPNGAGTT